MFRIKICGITRAADAEQAVLAGCDAIGLNFYPPSPRCVSIENAKELAERAKAAAQETAVGTPNSVTIVGVFVNAAEEDIRTTVREVGLDAVQLHGDESSDEVRHLADLRRVRALRIDEINHPKVKMVSDECRDGMIEAVLVDAYSPQAFGGTGHTVAWDWIPTLKANWPKIPTIVAGGLHPENVARAIETSRAYGVDVASGVESAPGEKDPLLMARFVSTARSALGLD